MSLAAAFLAQLPPTDFAMAYGSGVFEQKGYNKKDQKMIDLIVSVANPTAWHAANLLQNPHHYSSVLKYAGPKAIAWIQNETGAKLWFNTLVPATVTVEGSSRDAVFKYGVISTESLVDDVLYWRTLYLAGRLHKPVSILKSPEDLYPCLRINLRHALSASLLLLPKSFSGQQLFEMVTSLSYSGDFRMIVGENPRKIHNIVEGSFPGFVKLYEPLLEEFGDILATSSRLQDGLSNPVTILHQDDSVHSRRRFSRLVRPHPKQRRADTLWRHLESIPSTDVTPTIIALLSPTISAVVGKYARLQAVKGIATAGVVKSCEYAARKLAKMFR